MLFNHEGTRRGEEFVTRKITKGVTRIFDSIVNDKPIIPIEIGNVDAYRDWSDAEDMMDGVWKMLNQDKYNPSLKSYYNDILMKMEVDSKVMYVYKKDFISKIKDYVVGSGEKHTIREFIEKSFEMVGIKGEWSGTGRNEYFWYESGPKPLPSSDCKLVVVNPKFYRPAEVDVLRANPTKIKTELGWQPQTTFDDLIDKMVVQLTLI